MELRTDYSNVSFQNNGKLKLLIIVGTRPEIIRLAAVINKTRQYFDVILAHTGQNYDYNLNGVFFKDLKLKDPEVYMDAVGDDLGATCGNIINASYKLMVAIKPDAVLVWVIPTLASLSSVPSACIFRSSIWRLVTVARTNACPRKLTVVLLTLFLMLISPIVSMHVVTLPSVVFLVNVPMLQARLWQKYSIRTLLRLRPAMCTSVLAWKG